MKKQITFYIGWDIIFIIFLYAYASIDYQIRVQTDLTFDFLPTIIFPTLTMILGGIIISLLVFVSSKFKYNKKLAVIEFAIIGIPSFYLATIMVMPYFILSMVGYENMNYPIPMWAVYGQTPMVLGGVIFGYELFAFITKMIKFKRITTSENE